jgi:pimeloyl-ACP methyl ester carboxylesterase
MTELRHRFVETNGITMHIAEQGEGPLVVLCHGFPESWYSWRHQLKALAGAGFHAVAPDQRGYGQTDRPEAIDQYTLLHLVGDIIGLLDALGEQSAVVVGHDWGAPVAWNTALLRPDRVRGVAGLSVPFSVRPPGSPRPTTVMPRSEEGVFYQLYFQEPGVAEAEFERDVRGSIRRFLAGFAADRSARPRGVGLVPPAGMLSGIGDPPQLPDWLTEEDVDFYTKEFERTGFRGGLNWYRNIDRNWELMGPFTGATIQAPALFVAGEQDPVLAFPGAKERLGRLNEALLGLRGTVLLPGCGHWTQQERPEEVNAALVEFLSGL